MSTAPKAARPVPTGIMLAHFERMLVSLSKLAGVNHCLHDLAGFTKTGGGRAFCPERYIHDNAFCVRIKSRTGHKCMRFDMERTNKRMGRLRRPFVKKCHGGVLEAVVPVVVGGNHVGNIFLGPAREKGQRPPRFAEQLPIRTRKELLEIGELAMLLAGYVAQAAEALAVQDAQRAAHSEPIRQALRHASDFYGRPLSVAEVARQVFLSSSRFAHLFSRELGVPFHEYLTALRVERAKALLSGSSLSIGEISDRAGFCNQNYFTNVFRRRTGQTPTKYRRLQQKTIEI